MFEPLENPCINESQLLFEIVRDGCWKDWGVQVITRSKKTVRFKTLKTMKKAMSGCDGQGFFYRLVNLLKKKTSL